MLSERAAVAAALLLALTGCGKSSHESASTSGATTAPATTGSTTTVTSASTATTATTTKAGYEDAMQARIDLVAAQCYSPDPGVAAHQALQRYRTALGQLEAIEPPSDAKHAHGELIAVTRVYMGVAAKRIPPSEKLSGLIKEARADGRITPAESSRIQRRQQDLLLRYLPPRSAGKREGDALRELRRKGYDVNPKGPPKPEYLRRVQKVVEEAGNPAKSFETTTSPGKLQAQLRRQRDVAWRAARSLDDTTPPDKASYAQQKLVGALCDRGRLYDGLAEGLSFNRDPRTVRGMLFNARDADRMGSNLYRSAIEEYRREGYGIRAAVGPPR